MMQLLIAGDHPEILDEEISEWFSISDKTIAKFEQILRENWHITLDDLHILISVAFRVTIHMVFSKKLQYCEVGKRWLPRMLIRKRAIQWLPPVHKVWKGVSIIFLSYLATPDREDVHLWP